MIQTVSTGYQPREFQATIHRKLRRFNVLICHRRFGKTHLTVNEIIDRGLQNPLRDPQYAYIAPTYAQAKRVVWDIFKHYVKNLPYVTINEAELRIDIQRPHLKDRVRIILMGADNVDATRGLYLDGVVMDEYADVNPIVWTQGVMPTLSDRQGWAIFIGTPKGQNHFSELYHAMKDEAEWYCAIFKASQTGVLPESELKIARTVMSESEYEQEYECSFSAALVGAYYGKELEKAEAEGRIGNVPYDPTLPVSTYWDLGVSDTTCIWFLQVLRGREIRVIDYHEESGQGLDHYAKVLADKGYAYEEHVFPHDGAARELGTGKSRQEMMQRLTGRVPVRIARKVNIADGIHMVRMMLAKCYFDSIKCAKGLKALRNYERSFDEKNQVFHDKPKHNWASHGADGFRTAGVHVDENRLTDEQRRKLPKRFNIESWRVV